MLILKCFKASKKDYTPTVSVSTATGSVLTSVGSTQDEDDPADAPAEDVSMFVTTFPEGIDVNDELLARGQERFNIYCTACHGYSGNGDGLVKRSSNGTCRDRQSDLDDGKVLTRRSRQRC